MNLVTSIATIRAGTPFRERIVHQPIGRYLVVQGKDIGQDGTLTIDGMARIAVVPGRRGPDTLAPGEVVLQTRGVSYRAAIVPRTDMPMIAAGSLYVLTVDAGQITPEYLVFFLNLPGTQAALLQMATGSTILNLRRSAVEQLEIPIPTLMEQRRLSELGSLVRRTTDIEQQLGQLRLHELHALAIECGKRAGGASTPPAPNERSVGRAKRPQAMS